MKKLKVGVYGPNNSALVAAVVEGLEALGHRPETLYHATFNAGNVAGTFDAVVTCGGLRGKLGEIAEHYGAAGVPVIAVGDPLLPEEGHRLVVRGDLPGWLPSAEPVDGAARVKALSLTVAAKKRVKAQAVLILGQPVSANASRADLAAWTDDAISTLRKVTDSRIIYLPAVEDDARGSEEVDEVLPRGTTAAEAFDRSWLAVTHSSPLGLDALVAGLPVVDGGETVYSPLAGSLQRFAAIKPPPRASVERLLRAVLAAQWTDEEIATGAPFAGPLDGAQLELGDDATAAAPDPEPIATVATPEPVPAETPVATTTDTAAPAQPDTTATAPSKGAKA